eukprot:TRINITY_DN23245_c0_g1_i1.p1 TRINITY_DN23245_c0_g1~~TRINITY_DN23245_c0_g1_i1.p1  ORF type:complete len:160 (-),score=31.75 TRINITY_DN23245_c0_g1_i1:226-705(-)
MSPQGAAPRPRHATGPRWQSCSSVSQRSPHAAARAETMTGRAICNPALQPSDALERCDKLDASARQRQQRSAKRRCSAARHPPRRPSGVDGRRNSGGGAAGDTAAEQRRAGAGVAGGAMQMTEASANERSYISSIAQLQPFCGSGEQADCGVRSGVAHE